MVRPHRVVAGVLVRDGRILLGLRSAARRWYAGVWDLPGGHIEPGETALAALVRELHEELGIVAVVEPEPLFGIEDDEMELSAYAVTRWDGEIVNRAPDEHDELRFIAPEELAGLKLADPSYQSLLADAISRSAGSRSGRRG